MQNAELDRGGSRVPGARLKEFFSWLRGFGAPKFIPRRKQYGDRMSKEAVRKSDLGPPALDDKNK